MSLIRKLQAITFVAILATVVVSTQAAAQAANPGITVSDVVEPSGPVKPEIENPPITVKYTYTLDTQAHTALTAANGNLNIDFDFNCPAYVVVTGATTVVKAIAPSQQAGTSSYDGEAKFNVAIKRTAPGLEQIPCTVTATAKALGNIPQVSSSATPFSVSADYYSLLQATVASQLKQSGPYKQVPFQIELTNFGNARTQVNFELTNEPSGGKWDAILPTQMILESPNTGLSPTQGTATLTVSTTYKNGWNNEQGAYAIAIKSVAADSPDKVGNELATNFLVRVRGVYVPSLEPIVMLGAILGSALVLRMRNQDE